MLKNVELWRNIMIISTRVYVAETRQIQTHRKVQTF